MKVLQQLFFVMFVLLLQIQTMQAGWASFVVKSARIGAVRVTMSQRISTIHSRVSLSLFKGKQYGIHYFSKLVSGLTLSTIVMGNIKKVYFDGCDDQQFKLPKTIEDVIKRCELDFAPAKKIIEIKRQKPKQEKVVVICKEEQALRQGILTGDQMGLAGGGVIDNYMSHIAPERHPALYRLLVEQPWFWDLENDTLYILFLKVNKTHKKNICQQALAFKEPFQKMSKEKFEERKKLLQNHFHDKVPLSWIIRGKLGLHKVFS